MQRLAPVRQTSHDIFEGRAYAARSLDLGIDPIGGGVETRWGGSDDRLVAVRSIETVSVAGPPRIVDITHANASLVSPPCDDEVVNPVLSNIARHETMRHCARIRPHASQGDDDDAANSHSR